jgi:hypothetical protein
MTSYAVTTSTTKIAWVRDPDAPAGKPAAGSFRCVCGNTIKGVHFGAAAGNHNCGQCGRVWDGRGWLVRGPQDGS